MASFKEAWEETSAVEGGYVDDDDDRGGETYRGVARNFHPNWPGWDRIDAAKAVMEQPVDNTVMAEQIATFFKENSHV